MKDSLYRTTARIRFQECDPAGIVYHPNFLHRAEAAIEDWMREYFGETYDHMFGERRGMPRVRVLSEFLKPCRMGEPLTLSLRLKKLGRSSIEVEAHGTVDGEPRIRITIVMVSTSRETGKAAPIPAPLRAGLERYLALSQSITPLDPA